MKLWGPARRLDALAAPSWWRRWRKAPELPAAAGTPVNPKELAEAHRMLKYWQGPSAPQFRLPPEFPRYLHYAPRER